MNKDFFLGLGGQKCGSSWIQAYLSGQSGSDFGRLGEYQVWEHRTGGVFARYRVPEPSPLQKLRARAKMALGAPEPTPHLRWRLQSSEQSYFDYFGALLARPGIQRTGDITPSYAGLPADLLERIKTGMAAQGAAVKVLFSMRDPVDRLRSHLRMEMAKGRLPASDDNEAPLRAFYASKEAKARSHYNQTLNAIEQVFEPANTHICLFEDLFTPEGITALARFANVPADPLAGSKMVNAREKGRGISEALEAEIANHYAPVYTAVAARLPQVKTLWPSARFVL